MKSINKRVHTATSDSEVIWWATLEPGESQSVRVFGHSQRLGATDAKLWDVTILAVRGPLCVELTLANTHMGTAKAGPWQLVVNTAGTVDSWQILFLGEEAVHIDTMLTIETRSSADT